MHAPARMASVPAPDRPQNQGIWNVAAPWGQQSPANTMRDGNDKLAAQLGDMGNSEGWGKEKASEAGGGGRG